MPQPPTIPVIAHEDVRLIPALSQKTFFSASALVQTFTWEFDLAARITDSNQFLNTSVAPANSFTINGGGAGPQIAPQAAVGPFLDIFVVTDAPGGASIAVSMAADANPCKYYGVFQGAVPLNIPTNFAQLRITGRFVLINILNQAGGTVLEIGCYIRNL